MELAQGLGWPSVASGLAGMSSRELSEWQAFARREPIGLRRLDYLTAMIVAAIYNVNRDTRKHRKPFEIERFLPEWWSTQNDDRLVEDLSIEEQRRTLRDWAIVFGGRLTMGSGD